MGKLKSLCFKTLEDFVCDLDREPDEIYGGRWVNYDVIKAEAIKRVKHHKFINEQHCNGLIDYEDKHSLCERVGAIKELIEFFNLTKTELKTIPVNSKHREVIKNAR